MIKIKGYKIEVIVKLDKEASKKIPAQVVYLGLVINGKLSGHDLAYLPSEVKINTQEWIDKLYCAFVGTIFHTSVRIDALKDLDYAEFQDILMYDFTDYEK